MLYADQDGYTLTYRVVPMPADTNANGDVFGGWLMSQADLAGSSLAFAAAQGRVATVAVKEFLFQKAVFTGDLVSCYSKIIKTGTTSVTVHVKVEAARQRQPTRSERVAEATLVYVSLDEAGKPKAIEKAE